MRHDVERLFGLSMMMRRNGARVIAICVAAFLFSSRLVAVFQ
jgi:hypothetical protein